MTTEKASCSLRIEEKDIKLARKKAEEEGVSFSEYTRRRICADPIIEEKLNQILMLLNKK